MPDSNAPTHSPPASDPIGSAPHRARVPDTPQSPALQDDALSPSVRQIIETLTELGDAVIATTIDGRILEWSAAAAAVLGWTDTEALGASLVDLLDPSPAEVDTTRVKSLLTATQWQGPAEVSHQTQGRIIVHLSLAHVYALDDAPVPSKAVIVRVRPWPGRGRSSTPEGLDPGVLERALEHVDNLVLITSGPPGDAASARIVFVNEAFERTTGFRREDLLGRSPSILRGPDTDRAASERIDAAVRDRERVREEVLNYSRNGEPLWLDIDIIPVDGAGGKFTQWVAVERDVTAQKGQEVALRAREERLRLALNAVWDGLWDWHVPTGYCYYAPRWYSMLGFAEHALPPHIDTFLDLLHPQDLPRCEQALRDHFDGRTDTYALEVRLRTVDNNWRWVLTRGTVVERDAHERPVRMVGTHTDIAARKQAELALRTSEDRFRTLTMASPLGIFLTDARGACTFVTPRMLELWGAPAEALLGHGFLSHVHPDDRDRVRNTWRTAIRDGNELSTEYRVVRPDGGVRWVWERTAPHRDSVGALSGFVGTVEDITSQKQAAEDRRRLEAQMQNAQKLESLGVLAGGIAHDFNNLLVGILGNASVAREDAERGTQIDELLSDIEIAARRAADLTTQLLAYAGKGRFNIQRLDVSAAVRETSSLLQSAISKRASLRLELDDDLPTISADATQVRQVIMNLLTNASDALEEQDGVITLRTGVMRADGDYLASCLAAETVTPGQFVFVEVADTGTGMDAETLSRIFDPFYTTKFTGRGLGLAATLGIVRGHHGALHVTSEPGKGTQFRALFPAAGTLPPSKLTPRSMLAIPRRGTVLVVDDEETVREVARRMLERTGYTVLTAVDGRNALDVYAQHEADILAIVLDVTMPRMNGAEVLDELQRTGKTVPVVLASGYTEQTLSDMLGEVRDLVFVHKPFVSRELLAGIDAALARDPRAMR